jgi:hypothetical protein
MRFIIFVLVGSYRLSILCDVLAGTHRPIGNSELILVVKAPSRQQICWDVLSFSVNPDPFSEFRRGFIFRWKKPEGSHHSLKGGCMRSLRENSGTTPALTNISFTHLFLRSQRSSQACSEKAVWLSCFSLLCKFDTDANNRGIH